MKEHTYTVRGHWPFPVDMLRYDGSEGATPEDQALIAKLSQDHAPDRAAFKDVEVTLRGANKPGPARWESFGWSVPTDDLFYACRKIAAQSDADKAIAQHAMAKLTADEIGALQRWLPRSAHQ